MAFDKNKPHGVIYGESEDGARYLQDGVYYDAGGNEVGVAPAPGPQRVKGPKKEKPATAVTRPFGKVALPGSATIDSENRKVLEAEELAE